MPTFFWLSTFSQLRNFNFRQAGRSAAFKQVIKMWCRCFKCSSGQRTKRKMHQPGLWTERTVPDSIYSCHGTVCKPLQQINQLMKAHRQEGWSRRRQRYRSQEQWAAGRIKSTSSNKGSVQGIKSNAFLKKLVCYGTIRMGVWSSCR